MSVFVSNFFSIIDLAASSLVAVISLTDNAKHPISLQARTLSRAHKKLPKMSIQVLLRPTALPTALAYKGAACAMLEPAKYAVLRDDT